MSVTAKSRVSLKDIAREVGVDVSTVSRALNDSDLVRVALRERIKQTALAMRYVPNGFAYGLRKPTSASVAIGLPSLSFATGTFNEEILRGVETAFEERDFVLCLTTIHGPHKGSFFCAVREGRADGALIVGDTFSDDELRAVNITGIPAVAINLKAPKDCKNILGIYPDYDRASHLLVSHLTGVCKRERILFIGGGTVYQSSALRAESFIAACRKQGVYIERYEGDFRSVFASGENAVNRYMKDAVFPFDAVVCASDYLAMGVIRHLRSKGLAVGETVSVIGFDDNWADDIVEPALTSVSLKPFAMGYRGAQTLLSWLNGARPSRFAYQEPPELTVRISCGSIRAR